MMLPAKGASGELYPHPNASSENVTRKPSPGSSNCDRQAKVQDATSHLDAHSQETILVNRKRIVWPLGMGLVGALFLTVLYFGLVSWVEGPQHAIDLFWQERRIVMPLIVGFGIQSALYIVLKKGLYLPHGSSIARGIGPSGALTGAGSATSSLAMVACCAHHVSDALPILGLSAATVFLTRYQTLLMLIGLGITLLGIVVMLVILFRERRKALTLLQPEFSETL